MDQVKKSDLLKYAKNEYFAAMLGAKVARRLHATPPDQRKDPKAKVTSLALKLITDGDVEYTSAAAQERPPVESAVEEPVVEEPKVAAPKVKEPKVKESKEA